MPCSKPSNWDHLHQLHQHCRRNVHLYMRYRVHWEPYSDMRQQRSVDVHELSARYVGHYEYLCTRMPACVVHDCWIAEMPRMAVDSVHMGSA